MQRTVLDWMRFCAGVDESVTATMKVGAENAGSDNSRHDNDGSIIGSIRPPTLSLIRGAAMATAWAIEVANDLTLHLDLAATNSATKRHRHLMTYAHLQYSWKPLAVRAHLSQNRIVSK